VLVLGAAVVHAQVDGGWSAWSECNKLCDSGVTFRSCNNPAPSNGGAACSGWNVQPCNTQACLNCTVSYLSWYSPCTKPCGTGLTWRARYITQYPGPGGTPCPQLNFTYPCNTYMCMETITSYGYYFWGPIKGPGPIKFTFRRIDQNFDVFLFDQDNFFQYQYDAQRPKPYQTNYVPLRSQLNVEVSSDTVTLLTTTDYYIVVDHTHIGAARGTDNGDGTRSFNPNRFQYQIEGVLYGDGYLATSQNGMLTGGIINASATTTPAIAMIGLIVTALMAFLSL